MLTFYLCFVAINVLEMFPNSCRISELGNIPADFMKSAVSRCRRNINTFLLHH